MIYVDNSTKVSTAFGTLISIFVNIQHEDLIKTFILGFVGGIASFLATLLVRFLIKFLKNRFQK